MFLRLPGYISDGVFYHLGGSFFTPKPRMVQFPVCDRCNAKCIMCNRWKKDTSKEISFEKVEEVFSNDLFSKVEDVCLHGGEPTLRRDLANISKIIQDSCPKLKRIWISTNGFGTKRIKKRIGEILEILNFNKLAALDINVSLDGLEEIHDKIRGIKGGFQQCIKTIHMLKRLAKNYPMNISISTVIQPLNLDQIDEIERLAKDLEVPIHFQPLMFDEFFNLNNNSNLKFSKKDLKEFKNLIENKLIKGFSTTNFYWYDLLAMMNGAKRKSPCAFDRYVFSLYPTGEVLPCSKEDWIVFGNVYSDSADRIWFSRNSKDIRKRMRKDVCPTCANYCGVEFSLQKEFFKFFKFYINKRLLSRKIK
ncbi:MAG: radical SAM protein [Candidatus Hodarchaeota archaeon]